MKYDIIRFFKDHRDPEVQSSGWTLAQAQKHCRLPSTRGPDWFDGFAKEGTYWDAFKGGGI